MLKRRIIGKVMIAGVALSAVGMVAITGCKLPKPSVDYMGKYDSSGNCIKYGQECAVVKMTIPGGFTIHEQVVDLR